MSKEKYPKQITVIGGGSWGTALIKILSEKSLKINWWVRRSKDAKYIKKYKHNSRYLSAVFIDTEKVNVTANLEESIYNSNIILLVIPSAFVEGVLSKLDKQILRKKKIILATKGMIPNKNILIIDYIYQYFDIEEDNIAFIAGPCHAEEIAMEKQTYITVSSKDNDLAKICAELLHCRFINTVISNDLYGIAYLTVMKNIIAVACGIVRGLGYGDNFQSVLVSNAMEEIKRFIDVLSPIKRNMNASVYLGDLLVSTYSQFSRNRTFGNMIGKGYTIKSAQMEMQMIAEGYYAVESIYTINKEKYNINMPITTAVYHILYEKISPIIEFEILKNQLH